MTEPVLPSALAWAKHGHGVFLLHYPVEHNGQIACSCGRLCGKNAAKHPIARYAPNGHLSATTDTGIIKLLFGLRVPDANLGVSTEKLVVIDVDPRHGGDETFRALEREHEIPLTWRVLTGGGGEHILFACPDGVEIASFTAENMTDPPLGRGIDIRARGGYVVSVPSRHISGRPYCWSVDHRPADVRLATAPAWLVEKLTRTTTTGGKGHDPAQWAADKAGKFSEYRDKKIAEIAGKLLRSLSTLRLSQRSSTTGTPATATRRFPSTK
jgi:hypothetical protein